MTITENPNSSRLPGVIILLRSSVKIYKQNWKTFLGIMLPPALVIMAGSIFIRNQASMLPFVWFFPELKLSEDILFLETWRLTLLFFVYAIELIVFVGIQLWGQLALLYAIKDAGKGVGIIESYRRSWPKIISYLWIALLINFIYMGGFLLFILPGIYFLVWFSLAPFILVAEDIGGMNAFWRSRGYVKGWGKPVFWRLLFIMSVSFLILLPFSVFLGESFGPFYPMIPLLTFPFMGIYLFLIYSDLRLIKGDFTFMPSRGEKIWVVFAGILGLLIFGVLFGYWLVQLLTAVIF